LLLVDPAATATAAVAAFVTGLTRCHLLASLAFRDSWSFLVNKRLLDCSFASAVFDDWFDVRNFNNRIE